MKTILYIMAAAWAFLVLPGLIIIWWWSGSPLIDIPSNWTGKSMGVWLKIFLYYVFPVLIITVILVLKYRETK